MGNTARDPAVDHNPLGRAREFFSSFQEQAKELWDQILAPFSKVSEQDMKDFVADDDDEEGVDDAVAHSALDREQEAVALQEERDEDEKLAAYYNEKAGGNDDDDEGSRYSDDEAGGENLQAESSESEDAWVQGIRNKRRRRSSGASPRPRKRAASASKSNRRRRLSRNDKASDSSGAEELDDFDSKKDPRSTKRAILEDSDSSD